MQQHLLPTTSRKLYLIDLGVITQHGKSLSQTSSEATLTTITSSVPTMLPESLNKRPPIRPPQIMLEMNA